MLERMKQPQQSLVTIFVLWKVQGRVCGTWGGDAALQQNRDEIEKQTY